MFWIAQALPMSVKMCTIGCNIDSLSHFKPQYLSKSLKLLSCTIVPCFFSAHQKPVISRDVISLGLGPNS